MVDLKGDLAIAVSMYEIGWTDRHSGQTIVFLRKEEEEAPSMMDWPKNSRDNSVPFLSSSFGVQYRVAKNADE